MTNIDLSNPQEILLKSTSNRKVSELLANLGSDYERSEYSDKYYLVFKKLGIDLTFNKEDYLVSIFIYRESREYLNISFPYDLNLDLKMKDVERILGIPERNGGGSKTMNVWTWYPEIGIGVDYLTKDKENLEAPIGHLSIGVPENELSRLRFITKTEIHLYLQIRSVKYSQALLSDLIGIEPDRIDENLFEIYLSRNQNLTMKTQLNEAIDFIDKNSMKWQNLIDDLNISLKISVLNFRSNSIKFRLTHEHLHFLEKNRIEVEYEFMTT